MGITVPSTKLFYLALVEWSHQTKNNKTAQQYHNCPTVNLLCWAIVGRKTNIS